jgi:hypothetical protein
MTEASTDGWMNFADAAAGLQIPPALQPGIDRHRTHLAALAASLRAAGLAEAQIEASISTLVASYRAELVRVLALQ